MLPNGVRWYGHNTQNVLPRGSIACRLSIWIVCDLAPHILKPKSR